MLRVPIHKIQPGMILARPVVLPRDPRRYLLQRDHEIPMDLVPRLREMGILEVWIRCRDLEFLESVIDEGLGDCQRDVYVHVRKNFEQIMSDSTLDVDISHFQSSIGGLFDCLKQNQYGHILLQKLDAFDNYLMSHSTNVCYLALLLGMKLDRYLIEERRFKSARDAKDVQLLGLGCLLHDVGKMRIPREILNKPGKLTAEEMEVMKLHPIYGHEMIKSSAPPAAAEVALNHHQRWDGRGYPKRVDARSGLELPALQGKQIPVFSRIATVVDMYDAATSRRCYSNPKPPIQVLYEMRHHCVGQFDPVIEQAFREIIPPFPIGQQVTLSNGVEAVVVDFNARYPLRPKVQGIRDPAGNRYADPSLEEIDLAFHDDLLIASIDGHDVRPYQKEGSAALAH